MIKAIEKAILCSDLGLNPSNDGKMIRLVFPELTEERRKELVKDVKKKGEGAKVAVRNIRRDANDAFKKLAKQDVSEDEIKELEDQIQKLTDKYIKEVDKAIENNSDCIIVRNTRIERASLKKLSFCMEEIYERTKSYRDHSGRKRTLGKGTRNAENLRTCKGMRQS